MSKLENRVVAITGGGRGIGAAVARLCAAEGASVVVNDLGVGLDGAPSEETPAGEVVDAITSAGGAAVTSFDDISEEAGGEQLIQTAVKEFGRLDVLVNVAGILRDRMIYNLAVEDWDAVIKVHLRGHFNTIKPAAAYWREQRNPDGHYRIINFTSASGLFGSPGQPNYAAAKLGIVGLTYSCANALGRYGVTANAIAPGANTRMTDGVPEDRRPQFANPEAMTPENVAPIVAYLASIDSDWCSGQVIGAEGYDVTLFSKPAAIRQLHGTGPWSLDELGRHVEAVFRPALQGRPF